MEFTPEEIALVEQHRQQQALADFQRIAAEAHAAEVAETARRYQAVHKTVADLIEQAKVLLVDARQVAKDNGMEYQIGDMVADMINEVSNGSYWYGSDQSLC